MSPLAANILQDFVRKSRKGTKSIAQWWNGGMHTPIRILASMTLLLVGAALPVDVLTYEEKTLSAILRVCSSGLTKLWSSLTLFGAYKNKKCAFRVIQVSPFLLALSGNSREQVLD
ncbi:ribonuclease P protein subunit p14 isoform X2 [Chionomys nivalis]|uniref:ribonuclease P protein subunit p14 isoform X2 n=1 Tax=Chionomys nivalis TaxID=269649 RepID=UPI0025987D33|nr:ribonuclease P protein subunit p14 isoform X2 [Chionomys nivalis]